jgi:hypothetical protein
MKKLAVLSMTFLVTFSVLQGQAQKTEKVKETKKEQKSERVALKKLQGTIVDNKSKIAFETDFKGATNVQSKRVDTYDEFTFTNKDGQKMKAFYDENSVLVGTTQDKTMDDLPAKGLQKIKEMYKDYTIGPVVYFDDNELNETDMILWGIQFDDADTYFAELSKGTKKIIVKVSPEGSVNFFKTL